MAGEVWKERRGEVTLLTISNPDKRNALDPEMCGALARALVELSREGTRAAVLTGAGDQAFCSGFDLAALSAGAAEPRAAENVFDALINAAAATPVPLVCALGGVAFGGGLELAATCDFRIAHAGVKLAMPPARLGIVYGPRGLVRFSALIGESRARQLFLLARTVDAETALAWGLVDEIVPPADVLPRALALADEIAALAPLAVQGMRRTFEALLRRRAILEGEEATALALLRDEAWRSEDASEARRAFAEKRAPRFRGR